MEEETGLPDAGEITQLLQRWRAGDREAEKKLAAFIYPILKQLSGAHMRGNGRHLTLDVTDLANESYINLSKMAGFEFVSRNHFQAIAARVVRQLTIDLVRKRAAKKRMAPPDLPAFTADEINLDSKWIAVDQALKKLESLDAECAQIVELKFFSGMTTPEIAEVLGISEPTIGRRWRFAKAWLTDYLTLQDEQGESE